MTAVPEPAEELLISIDPGRAKCGVAVVSGPAEANCRHKVVVDTLRLTVEVGNILRTHPGVDRIIIGDGTGSGPLRRALANAFADIPIETVDEHRSSERARRRYLQENIPYGWRRLIPPSLRSPDRPYDDYVALILAEDYFRNKVGIMPSDS